ncbi:hypothetical protein CFK37_14130 [Virgibacillus phasianinus]|uniref:Prepilin-type cleavage/methylation domain-containing protein n=1 Tax=Virgibacillus phasianinus TaxID=2017483 RepID=A0A220U4K8_9BACI|nr:prepilin-type N-terminal cleavage/methylation domain-containing protein [Virgibacillus phasianinus]ASK63204.1 hypothetical protein CFK37_14130 [Virgibacillus phasianinus]
MKNSKGFTLIEVLAAFSITTMLIITVLPLSIQIKTEQQLLADRLAIVTMLYDELQRHIWYEDTNLSLYKPYKKEQLAFTFNPTNDYLQGCVEWINVKKKKEKSCLYGYPI